MKRISLIVATIVFAIVLCDSVQAGSRRGLFARVSRERTAVRTKCVGGDCNGGKYIQAPTQAPTQKKPSEKSANALEQTPAPTDVLINSKDSTVGFSVVPK